MHYLQEIYQKLASNNDPIMNLLMVMVIIWTTGVLFRFIKQPPVLGELLAGVIFGPPILGIIHPDETIHVLAELGAFFLMFYAGLETNPFDIKRNSVQSLLVAFGGFIVPFVFGYGVCHYFGMSNLQALFVGMALSVTAIAVNARVLTDLKMAHLRVTPVIIGASIVDDVLSLAVFTVIIDLSSNGGSLDWHNIYITILKVFGFFGFSILLGMLFYRRIGRYFVSREAKGFTFALIMALFFGVMAELAGLHIILGAYIAGLFVREGIVSQGLFQKISDRFVSIAYGFLGPIFFVSLAFHMTFNILKTHIFILLALLFTAVISKLLGAGGGAMIGRMNRKEALVVGCAMNGRGAVELIIASIGLELAIINDALFSIIVVIAFVTTLVPPVSLSMILKRIKLTK